MTFCRRKVFAPFLGRFPITVIWSPFLMMSRFQPCLVRTFGLLASLVHISTLPLSSFVSTEIITWGLLNWNSVTVPFTVVNFVVSYADVPWWAKIGAATRSRTAIPANVANNPFFICSPYRKSKRGPVANRRSEAPAVTGSVQKVTTCICGNRLYHCDPGNVKVGYRARFIQAHRQSGRAPAVHSAVKRLSAFPDQV